MKRAVLTLCILFAAAHAWAQTCSPTTFVTAANYPVSLYPGIVGIGDFTDDGKLDLVLAGQSDEITVLPGAGDGTFGAPLNHVTDYYAYAAAVGLFDAGSNLDIAIVYYDAIRVLPGDGSGSFGAPISTSTGYQPYGFVSADFNGDDRPDLAISDGAGVIHIYLGNGNGTFAEQTPIVSPSGANGLAAGSLDAGNSVDLVATAGDGTVSYWLGGGDGTFGQRHSLILGGYSSGVSVVDLNGDGFLDIAVTVDTFVGVFASNGNGTFQAAVEYAVGFPAFKVAHGDLDGDGLQDLLVLEGTYYNGGTVAVLLQKADGTLDAPREFNAGLNVGDIAVADLNGDGQDDLAAGSVGTLSASVLLAVGGGTLEAVPVSVIPSPWQDIATGDFFGEGRSAFAVLYQNAEPQVTVFRLDSRGALIEGPSTPIPGSNVTQLAVADFDADGNVDLAVLDSYANTVVILLGRGDGTFGTPVSYPTGYSPSSIALGDVNGDGLVDLVIWLNGFGGTYFDVFLNAGGGAFAPAAEFPATRQVTHFITADLDGDGNADIVSVNGGACCGGPFFATVYLSNGDGSFQTPSDYAAGAGPVWVEAADFDEDGFMDLVIANVNVSTVSILKGDGHGGFGVPKLIAIGASSDTLLVGDFDAQGHQDILAVESGNNRVALLRGLGNSNFQAPETYIVGAGPSRPFGGHFTGPLPEAAILTANSSLSFLLSARLSAQVPDASAIVGSPGVLEASASGFGTVSYQWRKDGVPLVDGGAISGSHTATLTIDPVAFTDAGSYDVVVTDSCTEATSNAATLSVEFDDVPVTNPFHDDILKIAASGITVGCTQTSFCPGQSVSRAGMAVLLLKAKFGADYVPPPPPPDPIFPDVPADSFAAAWIDELSTLGITGGCGDGSGDFCPNDPVTRGQMAVFLLKTLVDSGYVPPPPQGIFADVPLDYFAIAWIEDLYNRGITAGCGTNPLRYCPDAAIPREQMATFLVRTFLTP